MNPYLPGYLSASVLHLQVLLPKYSEYYITDSLSVPVSSEGEPIEIPRLIAPMVDFMSAAARSGRASDWFRAHMTAVVEVTLGWSQMTRENVRPGFALSG